ncbi:MAG: GNAT family N-acetyltransferase [Salinibacterium sp.]|nr:GNAT family N-acetyltransferase [Salinibacterium sp.]
MMDVRDIHEGDRNSWHRLFTEYGVFYKTEFSDTVRDGVWAWLMDAEADVCAVVAVDAGEVVGFAHYRQLPDTFTAGPEWYLDDLYVRPESRGSGAATALIDAVSERAASDGGGTLRWITAADNSVAQGVYDKIATRTTWITYEKQT